jgi:hypothetical protein
MKGVVLEEIFFLSCWLALLDMEILSVKERFAVFYCVSQGCVSIFQGFIGQNLIDFLDIHFQFECFHLTRLLSSDGHHLQSPQSEPA